MKKILKYTFALLSVVSAGIIQGCRENVDMSDRYTFKQQSLASYLQTHDTYSEYYRLLGKVPISRRSKSTMLQLLSARGHFSVFAPTNEAIQKYLEKLHQDGLISSASWNGFKNENDLDSIEKVIVYNSVIDAGDKGDAPIFYTSNFPQKDNTFSHNNMNDRTFTLRVDKENLYYINGTEKEGVVNDGALIDNDDRDIPAINGVMHKMHNVVAPSNETIADKLNATILAKSEHTAIAKTLLICGFENELKKTRDEKYEEMFLANQIPMVTSAVNNNGLIGMPEHRKYGFTLFAEKDEFWANALGIDPKEVDATELAKKMKDWVVAQNLYPDAKDNEDWTSQDNVLNQFLSYHILPVKLSSDRLVIHANEKGYSKTTKTLTIPVWEFYTTTGKRRLMKIYQSADTEDKGIYINRFPILNNSRKQKDNRDAYHEISCDNDKQGFRVLTEQSQEVLNGYIYPIERAGTAGPLTLAYDQDTRVNLQKYRIRFDATTISPELINNNLRLVESKTPNGYWGFNPDNIFKYLENISISDGTKFCYLPGIQYDWNNYQNDEINVTGNYEMTFKLPPVPVKGTYEIRYAVQNNSGLRGMCQIYFGTDPSNLMAMGIPLDLRIGGTDSRLGWEADHADDHDYNAEVDKKMRNYGFMKGPEFYFVSNKLPARSNATTTRRIIVRQDMDPDKVYYLKFKSVLDDDTKEFYMDYLEYCAKEVYDNPVEGEDIW